MKVNKFGRAAILTPPQITLLFNEGFTKPRDKALFGVCLYAAARINEACTLLRGDVIGVKGVREVLVIRSYNTKGKQSTREIQVHPQLKEYLEAHHQSARWQTRPYLCFQVVTAGAASTKLVPLGYSGMPAVSWNLKGLVPIVFGGLL